MLLRAASSSLLQGAARRSSLPKHCEMAGLGQTQHAPLCILQHRFLTNRDGMRLPVQHRPGPKPLQRRGYRPARNEERSWAEIASDAAEVAKGAANKVANSVRGVLGALVPGNKQEPVQPRNGQTGGTLYPDVQPRRRGASDISQALGGGIFGRIAGAALGGALDMMQEQQAKAQQVQERALRMIQDDERIVSQLGSGIRLVPGVYGSSSSTENINGRTTTTLRIQFNVAGRAGRAAMATVTSKEGRLPMESLDIRVQMPSGAMIKVDSRGRDGPGGGPIIDAEFTEIR